ncbi:hypothetical protein MUP01_05875 [Candidatus Bathyarchaeota archaeon]|nr:hypothetical protein [Candidatus Bathyarchaeota archaeon]
MNLHLKMRELSEEYGKHIRKIEIVLVVVPTLTFVALLFFPLISAWSIWAWMIALFIGAFVYLIFYITVAGMESQPYEVLWLERFRHYFVGITLFIVFSVSALFYLLPSMPEAIGHQGAVISVVATSAMSALIPLTFVSCLLLVGSISRRKKARLALKLVANGMELISREEKKDRRIELFRKYVSWFKTGLAAYNSYLFRDASTHVKMVDVEGCYQSVCCAALIGSKDQVNSMTGQMKIALGCMSGPRGGDDFKHLLIALKNIKNMRTRKNYRLSELNDMVKFLSFSDRVREVLVSPYFLSAIGFVTVGVEVILHFLR